MVGGLARLRYHNRRFVRLAAELGLRGPAKPAPTIGFSACTITDATAAVYAEQIDALDAERLPYLNSPERVRMLMASGGQDDAGHDLADDPDALADLIGEAVDDDLQEENVSAPSGRGRDGARFAVVCCCEPPRRLQVTPATWERGTIGCGKDFTRACDARC